MSNVQGTNRELPLTVDCMFRAAAWFYRTLTVCGPRYVYENNVLSYSYLLCIEKHSGLYRTVRYNTANTLSKGRA